MALVRNTPRQQILAGPNIPVRMHNLQGMVLDIGTLQDAVDSLSTGTEAVPLITTDATQSTSSTTGSIIGAGGLGIAKNAFIGGNESVTGQFTTGAGILENHTPIAINTTGAGTLAVVTSGVIAGAITSTSAAGVTLTLDSAANMIAAFLAAGKPIPAAGSMYKFIVDNSAGANTVTVAVDSGATLAVTTPAITGGATLTVSTANVVGVFGLYFTSATVGKLLRLY